jgi:hypothetical protein
LPDNSEGAEIEEHGMGVACMGEEKGIKGFGGVI